MIGPKAFIQAIYQYVANLFLQMDVAFLSRYVALCQTDAVTIYYFLSSMNISTLNHTSFGIVPR